MTGEITLRGRVLPIGGLKEKVLAAHRAGVTTVLFPEENQKDVRDIPRQVRNAVTLVAVTHMDEVIPVALSRDISHGLTGADMPADPLLRILMGSDDEAETPPKATTPAVH